jgi:hypothetical protein
MAAEDEDEGWDLLRDCWGEFWFPACSSPDRRRRRPLTAYATGNVKYEEPNLEFDVEERERERDFGERGERVEFGGGVGVGDGIGAARGKPSDATDIWLRVLPGSLLWKYMQDMPIWLSCRLDTFILSRES